MIPSSLVTKGLQTFSLSQKLILGFLAVILVLSAGMLVTLYNVNQIEQLGDNVIDKRQPISLNILKATHALEKSQNILHSYLLTGNPEFYEEYIHELESLELITGSLIELSNNAGQDTENFSLDSAFVTITKLRKFGDVLRYLQSNYEENHPTIHKAVELLNPAALRFLGMINDMILEISDSSSPSVTDFEILYLLSEIRHSWAQMMSYFRIALASRSERDLDNVWNYAEVNQNLLNQLADKYIDFGFGEIEMLKEVRSEFIDNIKIVTSDFKNYIWRTDAEIMKTEVLPIVNKLEKELEFLAQRQTVLSAAAGNTLKSKLHTIRYSNAVVLLSGLVVAILIAILITRGFSKRLKRISTAANDVAGGNLQAKVPTDARDEIGLLGDQFNNMVDQINALLREKDNIAAELFIAKDKAEKSNKSKIEFLTTMSHELQTPVNAILSFSDLLALESKVKEHVNIKNLITEIHNAGHHLLELSSEILDFSNIKPGNIGLNIENISVNAVADETLPFIISTAKSKNVEIINNIGNEKTYNVLADHTHLKQILVNLLTNAVKYNTTNGSVVININQLDDSKLKIIIGDTGIGILPDELERIFQLFERLKSDYTAEVTGIGLAVTTRLVHAMGGKIGVTSEPGAGSTFWVELDAA